MSTPSQFRTTGTLKDTVESTKPTTTPHPHPHPNTITKAAKPTRHLFDPWNSSATGHQRADNSLSGSTSWRDSRSAKLKQQFADGQRGGKRLYDTVGAGSLDWGADGRLEDGAWEKGAKGLRRDGQLSVLEAFDGRAKVRKASCLDLEKGRDGKRRRISDGEGQDTEASERDVLESEKAKDEDTAPQPESPDKLEPERQIFQGLTIYINGSTFPLISDHKLKRLLSSHGAHLSIALGRKTVTQYGRLYTLTSPVTR